ncbi:MAG: T9SS type A sorting domain-containing protein [Ignavibacteriaceae bacterium]|nr:T9SS type A sorting domain-containing protein [Ignavibacteriaceae bacterium]
MRNFQKALCAILLLSAVVFSALAQETTLPKIWSKVNFDPDAKPFDLNGYQYIPAPDVKRFVRVGNIEAVVEPNYRPYPTNNTTQSEMSVDVHPLNADIIFGSANTTNWPVTLLYGTGGYITTDGGTSWSGFDNPPYGSNSGDPASVIGTNGYFYEGFIDAGANDAGQGIARSTDNGASWTRYVVGNAPPGINDLLDKNHLTVDKKVGSPYENRVYAAWTAFVTGSPNDINLEFRYSTNFGQSWSAVKNISSAINAGSHNQGVNLSTGPNGEVYATWAVYDNWSASTYGEDAMGFAKSTDGGDTWSPAQRIYSGTNFGIRGTLTNKNGIRVSSFPSMAVDRTGGPDNGYIYISWAQKGVAPAGSSPDIVMIRSTDGGTSWSTPVRVNNDPINNGKDQYYNWMTVDQSTGHIFTVFYDSRNTANDSAQVYMARSIDGGLTFENLLVSDSRFKPKTISGLAGGYQGDYIGVAALNNKVYPLWADDRTGNYQGWMTKISFGPTIAHTPLSNTENLTGPYIVSAQIESSIPLNPNNIYVHWGRGASITDSVLMTNAGGNTYTANIPGNGSPAIYNYYIYAADNTGGYNSFPSGAPANYLTFEANTDLVPPVVTHTVLGNQFRETWPAEIVAAATDNIGVDSVWVVYKVNTGGSSYSFGLTYYGNENDYSGYFNIDTSLVAVGDTLYYRIVARDDAAAHNLGYFPGAASYSSFVFVNDTEFPVVSHQPLRDQARIKWPATVRAEATDNLGVQSVVCEYSVNNGALTGSFQLLPEFGSNLWFGTFDVDTTAIQVGDSVKYRLVTTDVSNSHNTTLTPSIGYNQFNIINAKGIVLVVDDDLTLAGRKNSEKGGEADLKTPLGTSSSLFVSTLIPAGYVVDSTSWANLDTTMLNNYDLVILTAGTKTAIQFDNLPKRTALVRYTLNGGKTLVEGGEVGWIYRYSSASSDKDPQFRRNLLLDSSWVSDYSNGSLMPIIPAHTLFNQPNQLTGPFAVTNYSGSSYASRDVMRMLPGKRGIVKAAGWISGSSSYPDTAGIFIYYKNGDTTMARNINFTFAISQFTNQQTARELIENAAELLTGSYLAIPVELVSLSAAASNENVTISWTTATETNNSGFEVERTSPRPSSYKGEGGEAGSGWAKIGFVQGNGTTTELSTYSFTDSKLAAGNYNYRLKQIDFDGTISYSSAVNVTVEIPAVFALEQNYPNPFNPSTTLKYSIPVDGFVNLSIYNMLGEKVATLINQNAKAGRYEIKFDASKYASGIYLYRLESGQNVSVKKMMLLK